VRNYRTSFFVLVLVISVALPSTNVVIASQNVGTQVQVCVNKKTKVVKYFKNRSTCPRNSVALSLGQVGPRGESGSSGSSPGPWAQYRNCFQKLSAALAGGVRVSQKADRDYFESSTGCVVETIADEDAIRLASDAGIPVIRSWQLVNSGVWVADGVGGMWGTGAIIGDLTYRVAISNHDAISDAGSNGTAYRYCLFADYPMAGRPILEHVAGDIYQTTLSTTFEFATGFTPVSLLLGVNYVGPSGCVRVGYSQTGPVIYEDPKVINSNTVTRAWGW
jgi:hypothetical protein